MTVSPGRAWASADAMVGKSVRDTPAAIVCGGFWGSGLGYSHWIAYRPSAPTTMPAASHGQLPAERREESRAVSSPALGAVRVRLPSDAAKFSPSTRTALTLSLLFSLAASMRR